jgi:hypothetical protein
MLFATNPPARRNFLATLEQGGSIFPLCATSRYYAVPIPANYDSVGGYYSATQIFLSIAFLDLLRVKRLEQADTVPAGELGFCLGLDPHTGG